MTQKAIKAAIKAISPFLTVRVSEGEYRVSVQPLFFQTFEGLSYAEACVRAEAIAVYDDKETAIANAKHVFNYTIRPAIVG